MTNIEYRAACGDSDGLVRYYVADIGIVVNRQAGDKPYATTSPEFG